MDVYFSTVIRSAPTHRGGELVRLDWESKRVLAKTPIAPTNPTLVDPNPRGNTRGGRGIQLTADGLVVCSFHTLRFFDRDLNPVRDVTHPLMVSLHEVTPGDDELRTLWTTSTAIDAALLFDLESGELVDARWPREMPGLQQELGITPLDIDKEADNRGLFLGSEHYKHPHHVHLNAVARHGGRLLALFSKFGAIADLDQDRVVLRDKRLQGAHNLVIDDGIAACSHSLGRALLRFDLARGERIGKVWFGGDDAVSKLVRWHDPVYRIRRFLSKRGLSPRTPPRPVFVRGLTRHAKLWFVGVSPATILAVDDEGSVVDHFTYSRDVNACVHGLTICP